MNKHVLISFIMILMFGTNALATTKTSSQSGNWSASATWGGNPPPVASDDVIINGGFTVTVDISNAACLSTQLGGSALGAGIGTLLFTSGSHLTVSGAVSIGPVNNNNTAGSVTMASGGTLTCEGLIVGRLGTWTAGTGTVEFTATNTIPNDNNIIFSNLTTSGGTTTISRNTDVNGNLLINTGATLNGGANTLTVGGNWVNNGTFTGNTGTVTFIKNGNTTITGSGVNNFNLIRVNLGTSISNTLEVLSTNFNAADPFLTIINGTIKMSGSYTFANTFTVGPTYNIDPTAGFWLNNPNVTVTAQAGGLSVRGLLRMSAGTYNVGTSIDNSLNYVTGSAIIIEGGALNIAGQLTRNNATATTSYTQSGGTVTVVGQGSTSATFAGFDLGAVGSTFTVSGGTIVIRNATSAAADYVNASSVAAVTGGTLQIGDASTANAQTIRIQSARPIGSLLVSNATAQAVKPTAQLVTSSLNVVGSVTMQSGTTLNANGLNLSVGGHWSNGGAFTHGGNSVTFNGSGAQSLTATGGETFNNLAINKPVGTLTLNSSVSVGNSFSLSQGTIAIGSNTLTLNSTVTGGGTLTSGSTGTVNYNQGSAGQSVLAGSYGNLSFSDFNKTLPSTGIIGVAGTFTPGTASGHTIAGSTMDFNGGSQAVPTFPYDNLTLSGSGNKTGSGTLTIDGNLTNNSGVVFSGMTTLNLNGTSHTNAGTLSTATLLVASGATLTNNGTITVNSSLAGAGTLTQGATGVLEIGGTTGITTLNSSTSGNTVNYSGASQAVVPLTYHHLTLSGSGTPDLTGLSIINGNFTLSGTVTPTASTGLTVGGNFTIGSGTSFSAGSFSLSLKGNWSNSGTFNAGTSTFTLNGGSSQTMSGSTFNNLIINNAAGVSMLSDETIAGTLTLTNGVFSIGGHTLTLNDVLSIGGGSLLGNISSNLVVGGSGASTTLPAMTLNNFTLNRASGDSLGGDVTVHGSLTITNGTLNTGASTVILSPTGTLSEIAGQPVVGTVRTTRNITAITGTESFGNIGVDITMNGVATGTTTILRKTGPASTGSGHNSIKRYFDITPTTNSGLNAGFVFHYDTTEVNGQNTNLLELYRSRDNGVTWNNLVGTVNTASRTISIAGMNDFSRWTAADTSNRIGNTATPATTNISPASKNAGDPTFTLTVNGTDFINSKSTVRFNGVTRTTSFVNTTQLTASIPASDLLVVGTNPVTVFNVGGGGLSNAQTFTVTPGAPATIRVETAADGSGTVVSAQSLVSGSSITVYAITRDALNNFVANATATAWTLENSTGGVVAGDLIPSPDGKSAVFTGHVIGTADIKATSGVFATTPSGVITVTAGTAISVRVETAPNGSGVIVPAESLASGLSISVYAITRDASNNFVANASATAWNLVNITGGVVAGDLIPSPDSKSAVFTGNAAGTANINASSGALTTTSSGTITVHIVSVTTSVSIAQGWNLISNPVTNPIPGDSVLQIYPTSFNPYAFEFNGGYVFTSRLVNGKGYWEKFPAAISNPITGTVRTHDSVSVVAGWNILGTISDTVDTSMIVTVPPGLRASGLFGYSAGYTTVSLLIPGKGYWVKSSGAGKFVLTSPSLARPGNGELSKSNIMESQTFNILTITDSKGGSQTLYFGTDANTVLPMAMYMMPPVPPVGAFDARFQTADGGSMVQTHPVTGSNTAAFPVAVQSDAYPLTVAWKIKPGTGSYELTDGHAGQIFPERAMTDEGSVTITNSNVHTFSVTLIDATPLPDQFLLSQNYPNPFNPTTQIKFDLPLGEHVSLVVYDIVGRNVAELANGYMEAGHHTATWNASNQASGVYFARFSATDASGTVKYSKTSKLVVMK